MVDPLTGFSLVMRRLKFFIVIIVFILFFVLIIISRRKAAILVSLEPHLFPVVIVLINLLLMRASQVIRA